MINAAALAETRTLRGLSQRKLATLAGLNYQVISRLEAGGDDGRLTIREFERICAALEAPPVSLLSPMGPGAARVTPTAGDQELDVGQARLLRRIQTTADVSRSLSGLERQTVLPTLLKAGLVRTSTAAGLRLSPTAAHNLSDVDDLP